jgi:hypothetical protein
LQEVPAGRPPTLTIPEAAEAARVVQAVRLAETDSRTVLEPEAQEGPVAMEAMVGRAATMAARQARMGDLALLQVAAVEGPAATMTSEALGLRVRSSSPIRST